MIVLADTIQIAVEPERVFEWLMTLDDHYLEWHPDHLSCRIIGRPVEIGSIVEVEELLHGKPHRLRMRITEIEPGRSLRYRIAPFVVGGFTAEPDAQAAASAPISDSAPARPSSDRSSTSCSAGLSAVDSKHCSGT